MKLNHTFPKDCRAWYRGYEHWKRKPSMIPQSTAKCLVLHSRLKSKQLAVTNRRCRQVQIQWATGTVPCCVCFFLQEKQGATWSAEGVVRNWKDREAMEGPQGEQRTNSKKMVWFPTSLVARMKVFPLIYNENSLTTSLTSAAPALMSVVQAKSLI